MLPLLVQTSSSICFKKRGSPNIKLKPKQLEVAKAVVQAVLISPSDWIWEIIDLLVAEKHVGTRSGLNVKLRSTVTTR